MRSVEAAFAFVQHRMEQHPKEIYPFAEWLAAREPHHVVEIGVRWGGTSALWCGLASGKVVGVDRVGQDSLGETELVAVADSLRKQFPQYHFICGDSHDDAVRDAVLRVLNGEPLDFLFLDGDHSLLGLQRDFELYAPLVRVGGCIAIHDIVRSPITAHQGGAEFFEALKGEKLEFCIHGEWGGIGVVTV